MGVRGAWAALLIGTVLMCVPQAQARDILGGRAQDFQRNTGNRLNDNWNRQRDNWGRSERSGQHNNWNTGSRNSGWGSGNSSRSLYGNMGGESQRFNPEKTQKKWQSQWEKQMKDSEDYSEKLQKQYDKITKQNDPLLSGGRRAAGRYGF